ncbi:MAG: PilZ domain-containing protein [Deltaproteobacteria bacterium]|nr:PilZ domain-containing protein [Deltaproteobacteria bacterium]
MNDLAPSEWSTRRRAPRAAFGGHADIFTWDGRSRCRLTDLSGSGAFLRCRSPLAEGKYVTLRLHLPAGRAFTVLGKVVRAVHSRDHGPRRSGMGLRFVDLKHRDRQAIQAYVDERRA